MTQIPQRLLGEALLLSFGKTPDNIAIISKKEELSYSDIYERSVRLASHLVSIGIKKGDRVAIYMNNSWQSVVSIYGTTLAGAVFVVINPQTKASKLKYILNDSDTKVLVSSDALRNELLLTLPDTPGIQELILSGEPGSLKLQDLLTTEFENITQAHRVIPTFPRIIPNDLAALIYTSGSTGFPKGVMMTHQSMVFTSWSLIEYLRLTDKDRILLVLPLAFDYGLYQLIMAITVGGTLIIEQSFTFPASIYNSIEKYKPTVFPGVPTVYAMMIASNKQTGLKFDCIEKVTNTAAALPAEFIPDLKRIFPNALIFKMYGLTECKRVCYLEPELVDLKPNSVGKAIPGTEVFLLSPEGKPVPAGELGILYIRGPHVMAGYLNKEELSAEMLKAGTLPGERILCSNDLFVMDEEGFLYFQGRTDDIIKTRGEKVSPIEIEKIIYKIDGVREVAIIGVPDEIMGESISAFVTTHVSCELTKDDILRECVKNLEAFMIPQSIVFLNEMPKSANGKFDKFELKKLAKNGNG
ncbi:MAG: class I adenylate-forming enzyme family protein [Candidatus Saccharimonadaceae bacterium]